MIIFTPDTWPLKLALTSPTAYEQALAYPAPEREAHTISDFIKTRGRPPQSQNTQRPPEPSKKPKNKNGPRSDGRDDRQRGKPKPDKIEKEQDELKRKPRGDDDDVPPDLGDVWQA